MLALVNRPPFPDGEGFIPVARCRATRVYSSLRWCSTGKVLSQRLNVNGIVRFIM